MKVIDLSRQTIDQGVCLMIGNYDGVHLGHRAIIARARELAREHGLQTAVLSFTPHPLKFLAPERAPKLLQTPPQKQALLASLGVDYYILEPFNRELASLSPEDFTADLKARVNFRYLLVGFNFRFGRNRSGDTETLAQLGKIHGFETTVHPAFQHNDAVVSSSRIRQLVAQGRMEEAAALLGRPYFVEGTVGDGDKLGRAMEAPTANVIVHNELQPRFGVYAGWTRLDETWHRSITNIGIAPTTGRGEVRFETHLLDFDGDLYGHYLFVCLGRYLRPEKTFASLDHLKQQIGMDIAARRDLPDTAPPDYVLDVRAVSSNM
ncbi:MAG: bifunctional riboflavin kinase/FAD synthetase [Acidobacteriota bacterium]|nr:bifunctional riboflavin kinase/FAD synthetase [Acidobacteriota bacterium]